MRYQDPKTGRMIETKTGSGGQTPNPAAATGLYGGAANTAQPIQYGGPNDPRLDPAVAANYNAGMNGGAAPTGPRFPGDMNWQNPQGGGGTIGGQPPQGGYNGFIPPTGLIGSEMAMMGGYQGGMAGLLGGYNAGRNDLLSGVGAGLGFYGDALGAGNSAFNSGARALSGAMGGTGQLFDQGLAAGNQMFNQGIDVGNMAFNKGVDAGNLRFNQGVDQLGGFVPGGINAHNRQAALSGALGADAQASAMQGFMESPQQAFLREQGERAVTRNAAALGGLGGGNVMKELSRFGTGLAAQDFDNQFNRLGQVSGQGLQAAGQIGNLRGQQGMMNANMRGQQGQMNANMRSQQGQMNANLRGQQANINSGLAKALAGLRGQQGQFAGNMGAGMAGLAGMAGTQLGNMGMQTGAGLGNMAYNTGQNLAAGRTRAGEMIAGNVANTAGNISNLINQQGIGLSGMIDAGSGNIANLINAAGAGNSAALMQLAQFIPGLRMEGAGYMAGLPSGTGVQYSGFQNSPMYHIGNALQGWGNFASSWGNQPGNNYTAGPPVTGGAWNSYAPGQNPYIIGGG